MEIRNCNTKLPVVVVIYLKSVSDVQLFARESIFKPIIKISFKTFENITNRLTNGTDFIGPYSPKAGGTKTDITHNNNTKNKNTLILPRSSLRKKESEPFSEF